MHLPNYKNGSIVNLMSSIGRSFGVSMMYPELDGLSSKELKQTKNVVLFIIDGMGYEFLMRNGKDSLLAKHFRKKITSAFPATTSCCITTLMTGVPAQQHAHLGWHMHIKEMGMLIEGVTLKSRSGLVPLDKYGIDIKDIFNFEALSEKIKADCYSIMNKKFIDSSFSSLISKGAQKISCSTVKGLFNQTIKAVKKNNKKKYICSYWELFDLMCHFYGTDSKQAKKHFREIDHEFGRFLKAIKKTDTTVIVVADHGLIDSSGKYVIKLEDHPKLADTLLVSLCGDSRSPYCYVNPFKVKVFESYVKNNLSKYCELHKSEDLIKKGYFGLFKPNKKLLDRAGNYILLMKDNYSIQDVIIGDDRRQNKACHGGVSKEEMFVPLIVTTS